MKYLVYLYGEEVPYYQLVTAVSVESCMWVMRRCGFNPVLCLPVLED